MPYTYKKQNGKYCVYKKGGAKVGCTDGNKTALKKYLAALHMNEQTQINEDIIPPLLRKHFDQIKHKFGAFIDKLKQEKKETKEAFVKLYDSVKSGEKLSKVEKKEIGDQMKDVLKVTGLTAASVLPGGIIYLLLSRIPALKKSMIPSAFLEETVLYRNKSLRIEIVESEQPFAIQEAEYQGKKVELGQVKRGGDKKFYVYVNSGKKNADGKVKAKKVSFGDTTGLSIKTKDSKRRKSFRARHNCDNPGPKDKARYWSCRMWSGPDAVKNMLK